MNLLLRAANWIESGEGGVAKRDIATGLHQLAELANELDDGLTDLIDEKCEEIVELGADQQYKAVPTLHAVDVTRSHSHEITKAVRERIAAAYEAGRASKCETCGECEYMDQAEPSGEWCAVPGGPNHFVARDRTACVKGERRNAG